MARQNPNLTIGNLSIRTGCKIETIRYYEKIGLLPSPSRSEGGHRLYGEEQARTLWFIRRGRELGFSIEELRTLVKLADERTYDCGQVKAITVHHLEQVRAKVRDLRRLERTLDRISSQCSGGVRPACPIIEALFADGSSQEGTNRAKRRPNRR